MTLTFDLLNLKVVSESRARVTWAISVPILVFLCLSVLDFGPMYATDRQTSDRQTDVRQHHCLIPPPRGRWHKKWQHKNSFAHIYFENSDKVTEITDVQVNEDMIITIIICNNYSYYRKISCVLFRW